MKQYLDLCSDILSKGKWTSNRTGVNTLSIFGHQMRFDLRKGFPAVTTKKLAWKSVVSELLWFLEGSTDERRLAEIHYQDKRGNLKDKKTIWTDNADNQGVDLGFVNTPYIKELGDIYGKQWRDFNYEDIDQIKGIIYQLNNDPESRRIILSAWNPCELHRMALPPCHPLCQFRVIDKCLHSHVYIRSNDIFLGAPFNIASYALLTYILARECGLYVGDLIYSIGDAHIYEDHISQVCEQLERNPISSPLLHISPEFNLEKVLSGETSNEVSHFELIDYEHHGKLTGKMAV